MWKEIQAWDANLITEILKIPLDINLYSSGVISGPIEW